MKEPALSKKLQYHITLLVMVTGEIRLHIESTIQGKPCTKSEFPKNLLASPLQHVYKFKCSLFMSSSKAHHLFTFYCLSANQRCTLQHLTHALIKGKGRRKGNSNKTRHQPYSRNTTFEILTFLYAVALHHYERDHWFS